MFFLAIGDILATLLLVRACFPGQLSNIPEALVFILAAYLILKALFFIRDAASIIDLVAGVLLIAIIYVVIPIPVLAVFAALLGIKGIMSLFAAPSMG